MTSPLTWPMSAPLTRSITAPLGTLMGAARGGAGAVVALDDAFIASGCTTPWYTTTTPNAVYHAGTNRTYVTWEAWNRFKREIRIKYYDHTMQAWSRDYYVSDDTLNDDDHGVPAIVIDADGYLWIFGGAHASVLKWWRSSSANDPSAWTAQANLASKGEYSYPHPVIIGSTLYLFLRGNDTIVLGYLTLIKGTLSAGTCTLGTPTNLVDYSSGIDSNRFYFGNLAVSDDNSKIYIPSAWSDDPDSLRRDVYAYVYETADGSLSNLDGTRTDAGGAQPVNLTNAKSFYRIVDQETGGFVGTTPSQCIDASGRIHYLYTEVLDGGSSGSVKHRYWNGSNLSSVATIAALPSGTLHHYDSVCAVANADGSITAQFTSGTSAFTRGGDQYRSTWTLADGWTTPVLFASAGTRALDRCVPVGNGLAELSIIHAEVEGGSTNELGTLKGYASGVSSPYLGTRWGPDVYDIVTRMPTEPSVAVCRAMKTLVDGLRDDPEGLWADLHQLWMPFSHTAGAALVPWKSGRYPLTVVGSPIFTAYGGYKAVSGGYWDTGLPVNALPDTNFMIGAITNPNSNGSSLAGTITTGSNLNFACNPASSLAFLKAATVGTVVTSASPAAATELSIGQRSGTTMKVFLGGTEKASGTATNSASNSETILFGHRMTSSSDATFYMMMVSLAVVDATWAAALRGHFKTFFNAIAPGTMA